MYQDTIEDYYNYTLPFYKVFWHGNTRAIHYGIWDESTRSFQDALLNTNKTLANMAGVQSGERVLDAGCGVGGSAFWLARQRGATVVGVTISEKQFKKAQELAIRFGITDKVSFYREDYTRTHFQDGTFDIVWAIESVCHASNKSLFLKEARRLLKSGGRLVLSDGFVAREPKNSKERGALQNFLKGFVVEELAGVHSFKKLMTDARFRCITSLDKTSQILPTSLSMARMSRWGLPLSRLTTWLGLTPPLLVRNNKAGIDQYNLFRDGVLVYCIFVGVKDSNHGSAT